MAMDDQPFLLKKGVMKSLMLLVKYMLIDLSIWCDASTTTDYKYVCRRVEHEGLSFLTISLPTFAQAFERCLEQKHVFPDSFPTSFFYTKNWDGSYSPLPGFLRGLTEKVFNRRSGALLEEPSIAAIWAVRQFTLAFSKMAYPCSDARNKKAIEGYLQCELDVEESKNRLKGTPAMESFDRVSTLLWERVLSIVDEDVFYERLIPKHGPGATADRLVGNNKWSQQTWTRRLDEVFPHQIYLATSDLIVHEGHLTDVYIREPGEELPARVVLVPKTQKTPRVIAVEPTCMQYMQQAISQRLAEVIDADDLASQLIGYSSQLPNQQLAEEGSRLGNLATLDLSEASDRVSTLHVEYLLSKRSLLRDAIFACRSSKVEVPGKGIYTLSKFASMGSALTFPLEAMVFMTVIFLAIESTLNHRLTLKDVKSYLGAVRVYGDDIIVPVDIADVVVTYFELYGFKVNVHKSFWNGNFRESCGGEYYEGFDINVVKVRRMLPSSPQHAQEIISTVSLRNQLYKAGLWRTAGYLDDLILGLGLPFPIVEETSPLLGRTSVFDYDRGIWSVDLHAPLVRGLRILSKSPISKLGGYDALLKIFSIHGEKPNPDEEHLERAGRSSTVNIKSTYGLPY